MTTFPGHAAAAFLAVELVSWLDPSLGLDKSSVLIFGTLAGVFPDIDALFFINRMHDHHNTPLHAPLFWAVIFLVLFAVTRNPYIVAAFLGISSHLFLDWYGGRIAGLIVFYPFSMKRYSLFPLGADTPIFSREYNKFYMSNKVLFFSEIFIVVAAIIVLVAKVAMP